MEIAVIALGIIAGILLFLFVQKSQKAMQTNEEVIHVTEELDKLKSKYKDIVDVEKSVTAKTDELKSITKDVDTLKTDFEKQKQQLNQDYIAKRSIYDNLLTEISIVEENLENISYGLYKPHFNYTTSEDYKNRLQEIWNKERDLIRSDGATYCPKEWLVGGSAAEGRKMVKHQAKLMLRAFNGECDSAISKVSWSNITNVEARIEKAFEAINKLGSTQDITITKAYADLKLQELRLEFELQEKLNQEKEEQRAIREQMREEEKALREMEKAQREAENEEERYQRALEKAKAEVAVTTGKELAELNDKIAQLEENLKEAQAQKQRAISQAQLTKSGHVYIISNIGSFGDHVYKIGMTRRLEPLDRINELGDASVPFDFDVHGMVYSENAPGLENILQRKFEHRRLNLVNRRAEFFNVAIEEIEAAITELNLKIQLTKIAEAKEYRETQSIREAREKEKQVVEQPSKDVSKELDKFPATLG